MPEVHFSVRWPDGSAERCWSPSRSIERELVAGASYPVPEFARRVQAGLQAGSDRLRELRGFGCSAALQQIEATAARAEEAAGVVTVESMRVAPGASRYLPPERIGGHRSAIVVGGGQAGLSASAALMEQGVDHLVLERARHTADWRTRRWDAFCLVTPNWQCRLPGFPYDGADPDGFMVKDELLDYLDRFVAELNPPLYEGVAVRAVRRDGDVLVVETSHGALTADHVILAVGGYHVPRIPVLDLPESVTQLHSAGYRNPSSLPDGAVLVVGTGQSGAQIAEDLHLAGRDVHLAVGSAPRVARFYRGRDCVAWLDDLGHYRRTVTEHGGHSDANHYVTGRDGGRDIDLRRFAVEGMQLHGRLTGVADGAFVFADDLERNLDAADATADRIKDTIDAYIAAEGVDAPIEDRYVPVWAPEGDGAEPLDVSAVRSVVWATGFTPDWSWVELPAFSGGGHPAHVRGVVTDEPGVSVLGLPWQHTWGSGRFYGVAADARFLAGAIAEHLPIEGAGSVAA